MATKISERLKSITQVLGILIVMRPINIKKDSLKGLWPEAPNE